MRKPDTHQRELPFDRNKQHETADHPLRVPRTPTVKSEYRILAPPPLLNREQLEQLCLVIRTSSIDTLLQTLKEHGLTTEAEEKKGHEQACYLKEEGRTGASMTWPQYLDWRRGWFLQIIERVKRGEAATIAEAREQMEIQNSLGMRNIRNALERIVKS